MSVVLVFFKPDGERKDITVSPGRSVIGRAPECDIQAPVGTVSREHCSVRVDDESRVFVSDLGSSNGTYVNSDKIESETELAPGDRLAVGALIFTLQVDGAPADIEQPILEAPGAPSASGTASAIIPADPDDSSAELSDLIAAAAGDSDDSSVFEFDIDLDDDED